MEYKEFSGKTIDEALTVACEELGASSDKVEYEVVDEGASGFLGIGAKLAVIKARVKDSDVVNTAKTFLNDVFAAMQMAVSIDASYDDIEKELSVELVGDDMGILIGKRGQTLDSLQYLVSLVVNKETDEYVRVKVDTENYRERRKQTLENLAKNMAFKVKRSRRNVSLEPMNPYERRIIHSTLQDDKYVETHSEGEEPYRYVIITPKKGEYYNDRGNGRYNNNRGRRY
ncbi:MAG: protein jag [Lachnospiraceae bacterium]|nr:protein jag [Lachnospiraceae bacterium]